MKWLPPAGSTQHSADGRYVIVQANTQHWVAYQLHSTTATELSVKPTDAEARTVCDTHESQLIAARKSA